jgi:hypothetical protein
VRPEGESAAVDRLHADLLAAGEQAPRLLEVLRGYDPEDPILLAVLRRAVPVRLLEHLGTVPPWSDRPRLMARVVLNPRVPRALALRVVSSLYWHDLAEVAAAPHVAAGVRVRAEATLRDQLPDLRMGDRMSLAKIATLAVLPLLLADLEPRVTEAALINPRLREEDLLVALRSADVPPSLIQAVVASPRWSECYAVRLGLVLQPRTPLAIALAQIRALVKRDLVRVVETAGLRPLVQAAAATVLERLAEDRTSGGSAT